MRAFHLPVRSLRWSRPWILLGTLLLAFTAPSVAPWFPRPDWAVRAAVLVVLAAAALTVAHSRRPGVVLLVTVAIPGAATFGPRIVGWPAAPVEAGAGVALGAALIWCSLRGIVALFRERDVTADGVATALCSYLLIGLAWALFHGVVEDANPGSFRFLGEESVVPTIPGAGGGAAADLIGRRAGDLLYFSFATLTTLGFGDIVPVSQSARALTTIEAVAGQFFMAVVLAHFVGLEIATAAPGRDPPAR